MNRLRIMVVVLVVLSLFSSVAFCAEEKAASGKKKSLGAKTIASLTPVWVIGSYDAEGKPNMMTASWAGISCSKPPCVAVSLRKVTYTFGNIVANAAFTVNIPSEQYAPESAFFGTVSGRDMDKLAITGLTPVRSELVNAPYLKEFPLILECKVARIVELGRHTMFIGEIVDVKADESILDKKGMPNPQKLKPFFFDFLTWDFYSIGKPIGKVDDLQAKIKR